MPDFQLRASVNAADPHVTEVLPCASAPLSLPSTATHKYVLYICVPFSCLPHLTHLFQLISSLVESARLERGKAQWCGLCVGGWGLGNPPNNQIYQVQPPPHNFFKAQTKKTYEKRKQSCTSTNIILQYFLNTHDHLFYNLSCFT